MTAPDTTVKAPRVSRRAILLWLIAYAIVLSVIVIGMLQIRRATLRALATPEAQAAWKDWREAPPNVRDDLPVRRRPPSSDEPPALVLLRDHFPVMLGAAVVFGSLLFGVLSLAARGAFWHGDPPGAPPEPGRS